MSLSSTTSTVLPSRQLCGFIGVATVERAVPIRARVVKMNVLPRPASLSRRISPLIQFDELFAR